MVAGVAARNAVIAIGVCNHAEVLICLHKRLSILGSVAEMNIVVSQAVTDEQCTAELVGTGNGVHGIIS